MSKKMLKRSLALGALMAFVITGSAMAAENYILNKDINLSGEFVVTDKNVAVRADGDAKDANGNLQNLGYEISNNGKVNITVDAEKILTITHTAYNGEKTTSGIQARYGGEVSVDGNLVLNVENNSTQKKNFITAINTGTGRKDSKITFAGDNLTVTAKNINPNGYTAQGASGDGNAYFNSKNTTINAESYYGVNGVAMSNGATAYFNGEYVTINATLTDEQGCNAIGIAENIVVNSNVKEFKVNVTGSGETPADGKDRDGTAGLLAGENDQMTINAQKLNVSVTGSSEDFVDRDYTHGIKVMGAGSKLVATGATTVTVTDSVGRAYGVYGKDGADIDLAGTNITATGNSLTIGIIGSASTDIDLANTTISSTSEDSRADGINLENCKEMNVAGTLNITAVGNGVHDNAGAQGIRLAYTSATFADDVEIHVTSNQEGVNAYGLNILSDTNFPLSDAVFKDNVTIDVEGGNVFSVLSSGSHPAGVTFEKGDVSIEATADGDYAVGIAAAYNSSVKANAETNIKITATAENGLAQAVNNTLTKGGNGVWYGNGKIELLGNVELIAKGKDADNSLAIYNEYYDGYGNGTTVVGSEGKKVVIDGNILTECGSVTVTFGAEGSRFDGKVTTEDKGGAADKYTKGTTTLNFAKGATWNLTGASTLTNATFAEGSVLKIGKGYEAKFDKMTGEALTDGDYAITAVGEKTSLTIANGAKLQIEGIKETTYNIAKGFGSYDVADKLDIADNALLQANEKLNDGYYQVEVKAKEAEQMATEMGVSNSTAQSIANVTTAAQAAEKKGIEGKADGTGDEKAVALINAMSGVDSKIAGQVFEAVSKMAEAGGNSGTAASIVKNVTGVTNDRLSFNCGHSAPHKGGHGVGLFEEGSGADIWVEYVHGKDEVEDMPSTAGKTSYEGQYNGIVMGVDFKKVNKFQSGFAFNYGEGDTNSVGSAARTHSDYDFWGIGYYGSIHNDDSNVIFDIGYAKTDSDVETKALGMTYNASPETTTWTAGVKVEKLYQNENVQIVPYTGLRFMSIDPEDYSTECASSKYDMERQNVWLLPLGVSIRQEIANDNGWIVSPKVDLSYIWAFGDTDSEMEFSTLGTKTNIGYEVMDDGSFLGLVGIEAHKGQWGFGVSYSYQKGDHSESKKWFIDANYSF